MNVRQSTAATVIVGPILDADGVAKTDEVVGSLKIHKNGGAAGALDGSATLTHSQTGFYRLALTANDLDTLGRAEISLNSGTNSMPVKSINVMTQASYDALYATDGAIAKESTLGTPAGASLAADIAAVVGSGSGPNAMTLTFEDQDENAVQGVSVGVYDSGVLTAVGTTDASGQIAANVANGEYSVRAFKSGYQMDEDTLTAPGDNPTYTITRLTPAASTEPDTVTGRYLCRTNRVAAEGVSVYLQQYDILADETGQAWDDNVETQTSDENGYVYFQNLVVGTQYRFRRGTSADWKVVTIPADDDDDGYVDLESIIG